ncbi:hypothetical protein OFB78_29020, partial [Escherichia coli]|nr:hypothetical protein [Escherichia coli]
KLQGELETRAGRTGKLTRGGGEKTWSGCKAGEVDGVRGYLRIEFDDDGVMRWLPSRYSDTILASGDFKSAIGHLRSAASRRRK